MAIYKFKGVYTRVIVGHKPIDWNDRGHEHEAIQLELPEYFCHKAKVCWKYFSSAAAIFAYKGKIVVTDESLELTDSVRLLPSGNKIYGCTRWICDSWSELEQILAERYDEFDDDERDEWENLYTENPEFDSVIEYKL